jgi:hypothetical protein
MTNVARSVVQAVKALRAGQLSQPDKKIKWPARSEGSPLRGLSSLQTALR